MMRSHQGRSSAARFVRFDAFVRIASKSRFHEESALDGRSISRATLRSATSFGSTARRRDVRPSAATEDDEAGCVGPVGGAAGPIAFETGDLRLPARPAVRWTAG